MANDGEPPVQVLLVDRYYDKSPSQEPTWQRTRPSADIVPALHASHNTSRSELLVKERASKVDIASEVLGRNYIEYES
jgi:hypothetical protein